MFQFLKNLRANTYFLHPLRLRTISQILTRESITCMSNTTMRQYSLSFHKSISTKRHFYRATGNSLGYLRRPFELYGFRSTLKSRRHDGTFPQDENSNRHDVTFFLVAHYFRYDSTPIRHTNRFSSRYFLFYHSTHYSIMLISSLSVVLALLAKGTNLRRIFTDSFL